MITFSDSAAASVPAGNLHAGLRTSRRRRFLFLDGDELCAHARFRTRLEDFGDAALESRLSVLVRSLESEANLHPIGRFLARGYLQDLLETRLRLANVWQKRPGELAREYIRRPIFITGMPRSGSTFLHELLAQDRANRVPLVWEVMFPFPMPLRNSRDANFRRRKAAACLWAFRRISPRADCVHPLRATTPQECVAIHGHTFLSHEFSTIFHVPTYEAFLNAGNLIPAYLWQKKFLQYLQLQCRAKQWVLKAPDHVLGLDSLFAVFPDAVIIQTHRDPFEVLKSSGSLLEVLRRTFAWPEDRDSIGAHEARALADSMNRTLRFRDAHPELAGRFIDVNYERIVSDPLGAVRYLYQKLGLQMTPLTIERLGWLIARRSRYGDGGTPVTLKDFGINYKMEQSRFANYCARFSVKLQHEPV